MHYTHTNTLPSVQAMFCEAKFLDVLIKSVALFPQLNETPEPYTKGHVDFLSRLRGSVLMLHLLVEAEDHLLS